MIDKNYRKKVCELGDKVHKKTGLALSTIAAKAAKDGDFFDRMEAGGTCYVDTCLGAMEWLESQLNEGEAGNA